MANPLKRLAGETAVYGLSSIIARILNFLLVPIYTYMVTEADYGVITNFMAYIAIFQVVLTLGLETGCFRFAMQKSKEDPSISVNRVFSSAAGTVLVASLLFTALCLLFSKELATALAFDGSIKCLVYVSGILLLDCVCSIFFARLRYEHRALKFAIIKTVKICSELGFNLLFFLVCPNWFQSHPDTFLLNFISPNPDYTYILFAIFLSCIVCAIMFLPDFLRRGAFSISRRLWKPLMLYSLPLMIAGLPGIMNDMADRILFRFCMPVGADWQSQLGIFAACTKLAVLINLFIQMFRYAAEPFFFGEADKKDSKQLYSKVLNYFTAFCVLIALGILLYMDLIEHFIGPKFRVGVAVVPIMILAYTFLGIYFNVSMWFKLSGKTIYAVVITCAGLVFTLAVNIIFMPRFGYMAAAFGHLLCYFVMLLVCAFLGHKYYPVPYNWGKVAGYIVLGAGIYIVSLILPAMNTLPKMAVHTFLILCFLFIVFLAEKKHLRADFSRR